MALSLRSHGGFTMLELIAVLIIMAIIGAVVVARVMDTGFDLVTETDLIKTHLRYAQARAMNTSVTWGINLTGTTYSLFKDGRIASRVNLPNEATDIRSLPDGISVETAVISFDAWGIPHTAARATDRNKLVSGDTEAQITVSDGSDTRTITITPNTGFIP